MMNSPFLKHVVDGFPTLQQISEQVAGSEDQMITRLYRQFFQRNPSEEELQWGLEFMGATDQADPSEVVGDRKELWTQYVQTLLMSNELVFVD